MDRTLTVDVASASGDYVAVFVVRGPGVNWEDKNPNPTLISCLACWAVHRPKWFERLMGSTWQNKINAAVQKAYRFMEKLEAKEESAEKAVKKWKSSGGLPTKLLKHGYQPRKGGTICPPPDDGSGVPGIPPSTSPDQIAKPDRR